MGSETNPTRALLRARGVPMKADRQASQRIDPSKTDVFVPGPDGKLQPIPGWRTTGPFDFGTWAKYIDWGGVARDLATIGAGAVAGGGAPGLASKAGVTGVVGEGLTGADAATLGGGMYSLGDAFERSVSGSAQDKGR
ncbi:hypothetical protein [Phenylobacterium sp.]|uniref:hypothetical protein n=1 Tax=Phenylobacterium sp. TaxID=1871053 RepID=UPI0035B38063